MTTKEYTHRIMLHGATSILTSNPSLSTTVVVDSKTNIQIPNGSKDNKDGINIEALRDERKKYYL